MKPEPTLATAPLTVASDKPAVEKEAAAFAVLKLERRAAGENGAGEVPATSEEGAEGRPAALNLSTAAHHQSLSSLYAQQEQKMPLKQVELSFQCNIRGKINIS